MQKNAKKKMQKQKKIQQDVFGFSDIELKLCIWTGSSKFSLLLREYS